MNPWFWLLFLLLALFVQTCLAAWVVVEYLLPALELRRALRLLAGADDWDAVSHIVRRGRLAGAMADLAALGERLHRTHRQLGDESLNLQAILGSLVEGVLIVDAAGRVRLANDSVRRMFDLTAPPLDRTLMEVFRDHTLQETVRAALETDGPQYRELTLDVSQGGRYVRKHFAVTAAALHPPRTTGTDANGRPVQGAIAIFHDISELKALEAVRRDFVANVSHELRTPVSIISGYLETLLDGALDDREAAARFVQVMWKHSQRLTLLIEDLLSLAQLEGQRASGLRFEPVDLRGCLEKVVERLEPLVSEKGAAIRLEIPAGFPRVEADAHRLDQVFFNLLENALRHGTNGHPPEVRVRAESRTNGGEETAEITVSDNGPGIPLGDQPHVFERFYRVRKDRAREAAGNGGTGLGLSIVKHVVQAHGGQVWLDSQPGRGATFRLCLPMMQKG